MIATTESAICSSTTFLENYLDCVETLPDDMQRNASQLRELDLLYQDRLKEIEKLINTYHREKDASSRRKCLIKIQRQLVKSQEYGDEKLQLVGQMVDMVDNKSRQIEADIENLDTFRNDDTPVQVIKQEMPRPVMLEEPSKPQEPKKRNRRQRNHDKAERDTGSEAGGGVSSTTGGSTNESSKPVKKKAKTSRKKSKAQNSPTQDIPIDPNEPTYCLCNQVSFGEMIGCDNDDCPIEWFHFQCVGLSSKPKGKWYCPKCTQERKRGYMR